MQKKNIHEGHRARLLDQIHKNGLENMTEIQVLEFVLTFFIPRKDTNDIAHYLINTFGNLKNVLDAAPEELMKVNGIGERVAKNLSLLPQVFHYYKESGLKTTKTFLKNIDDTVDFLNKLFEGKTEEEFYILFLAANNELIKFVKMSTGNTNEVNISCQDIINKALKIKPSYIILAHNHPHGFCEPSTSDVQTTNKIIKMLYYHQLVIVDHIIIGKNGYYSFNNNKIISSIYNDMIVNGDEKLTNNILSKIIN